MTHPPGSPPHEMVARELLAEIRGKVEKDLEQAHKNHQQLRKDLENCEVTIRALERVIERIG
jgi:chromosome condensin MukBEF ATPase and DNA-binding subunit MukB